MKAKTLLTAALALGVSLANATASADTFRAGTWNGANSENVQFLTDFANLAKKNTDGSVQFEIYSGGTLLTPKGSLSGLGSGIAQIGNVTAIYIPSDMPYSNVVADLSFLADDQMALAFAATEEGFFNKQLQEDLKGKNVVFATSFTIGIYSLICGFDAHSIDDFKGKKIRASTSAQIEYAKLIGGTAVNVPATEIYTGIQRGSLDCAMGTPTFLTNLFKLNEVAKSDYLVPLGSNANGGYYFNKDFWQARTPEERRALLKALSRATAESMVNWGSHIDDAFKQAREANVKLVQPEKAVLDKLDAFKKQYISELPKASMEKRGIADPTPLINQTLAAMDKWKKLLSTVDRHDVDAVTALLDREIFDKIDVKTYGMN